MTSKGLVIKDKPLDELILIFLHYGELILEGDKQNSIFLLEQV